MRTPMNMLYSLQQLMSTSLCLPKAILSNFCAMKHNNFPNLQRARKMTLPDPFSFLISQIELVIFFFFLNKNVHSYKSKKA